MTTTERSGISRRDIIKKGAIAGAVFWSVPVIESVTSAASATSGSISCSWAYIAWAYTPVTSTSTVYVSGYSATFQAGSTSTCTDYSNTSGMTNSTASTTVDSTTFVITKGDKGPSAVTFSGFLNGTGQTPPSDGCTDLTQTGNTIQAASNVVILAYFVGPHGQVAYAGPDTAGATITLPNSGC